MKSSALILHTFLCPRLPHPLLHSFAMSIRVAFWALKNGQRTTARINHQTDRSALHFAFEHVAFDASTGAGRFAPRDPAPGTNFYICFFAFAKRNQFERTKFHVGFQSSTT